LILDEMLHSSCCRTDLGPAAGAISNITTTDPLGRPTQNGKLMHHHPDHLFHTSESS